MSTLYVQVLVYLSHIRKWAKPSILFQDLTVQNFELRSTLEWILRGNIIGWVAGSAQISFDHRNWWGDILVAIIFYLSHSGSTKQNHVTYHYDLLIEIKLWRIWISHHCLWVCVECLHWIKKTTIESHLVHFFCSFHFLSSNLYVLINVYNCTMTCEM